MHSRAPCAGSGRRTAVRWPPPATAASNESNDRQAHRVVRVIGEGHRPRSSFSTTVAAANCTECPEVYSGNGGVPISGVQVGSMCTWMQVMGRNCPHQG